MHKKFHSVTMTHMQPARHDTIHKQSHVYHTRHCGSVVDRWAHGTASADCVHRSWTARTHHIKVLHIYTVSPAIAGGQILLVQGQVTIIFVVSAGSSVCLFVCLCRVFVSCLWSDFDQTRRYVICLDL